MISKEEFIALLEPEFDELPKGSLQAVHEFRSLEGWNSMLSLIIVSKINKVLKVNIHSQELAKATTIEDLFVLVESKLQ